MTEKRSERLGERYLFGVHASGLPIYVFPKRMTTAYAILAARYGSVDARFSVDGCEMSVPDGVAHFLEHKLFENEDGSDSFERFSAYGADANAYTTSNRTAYLFSCTEHFEESLRELLQFVTHPHFTPASVKKEQGIIAEEIRMYHDNPWERCFQNLMEGLYERNPVRKNICGSEESIAEITPEILYACYHAFYQPSNMALIVCGDVDADRVNGIVDECLGTEMRSEKDVTRLTEDERADACEPKMSAYMQVAKPIFSIGIKDPEIPSDPADRQRRDAAMSLLDEILFSRSARFYSSLFEEGILSPAYSYGYSIADRFAFHTVSGESEQPEEVMRRLRSYLREAAEQGIDKEEFERCRRILYADQIRSYDSTEEIANNLLAFVFDDAEIFEYPDLIASLTVADVEGLLAGLLDESRFCLSVVYPHQKEKENRNVLQ